MKTKLLFAALLCTTASAHASCGSSFCAVNTNWDTQGLVNDEGMRIDLRYSYANANKLRYGNSAATLAAPNGTGRGELENMRTINQMLNLDMDYAINQKWNVAFDLPLVIRDHAHTFDYAGGWVVQQAKFNELGDMRVVGKYKFDSDDHYAGSGITFGFKLPTGAINKTMTPQDPTALPGTPYALDRSSQPGSGSTDIILGAYYHHDSANTPWGWFASGQLQSAVSTRNDYRPGNGMSLDVGVHYAFSPALTGMLQLNTQVKERDSGLFANTTHSGGHSLNLSPGLSYAVVPKTRLYSFVQLPIVQYVNGDATNPDLRQLTAPWSFSIGISHSY